MNELWIKVAQAVDKKFKTTLRNAKIVAALKIAGLAIVIVAAAALTITASVLGALAAPTGVGLAAGIGLAIGGIATIAAAASKIHTLYAAHWPDHKTAAAAVKTGAEALRDALAYEEKKLLKTSQGATLGPKEKAKLFFGNTKGKRADLAAAIKTLCGLDRDACSRTWRTAARPRVPSSKSCRRWKSSSRRRRTRRRRPS